MTQQPPESNPASDHPGLLNGLLFASVVSMPVLPSLALIGFVLIAVYWLFFGDKKSVVTQLRRMPAMLLSIALFLFYLAGMAWTENTKTGWDDVIVKLPLAIFPVIFCSLPLTRASFRWVRNGLVYGCLLAFAICFADSTGHYLRDHEIKDYYYTSLSILLHPTYFTMYVNLAILMIVRDLMQVTGKAQGKIINWMLLFLFIALTILLSARMALITVFFTTTVFVVLQSWKEKRLLKILPYFLLSALLTAGMMQGSSHIFNRFEQIEQAVEAPKDTVPKTKAYYNSTTTRVDLLRNGVSVFKEHWLIGVGTGDVMDETVVSLKRNGLEYLAEHYSGSHIQYLQTAIALGIGGIVLFLLVLLVPLFMQLKQKEYLYACFLLIVCFNAAAESVLRASALMFFCFFNVFFYMLMESDKHSSGIQK